MDDNLKAISLAVGTDAGGIAVAPDGVVWVADKRDAPKGTAGQIFSILPDGSKYDAHPLPKVPDGREAPQPAYIALQTSGNSVEAIWVSDNGAGVVYRLKPGTNDPQQVVVVDLGKGSRPRGLAWDQARQRVWVADEGGHQLLAIDPASNQPDPALTTSRPGSAIALVAVAPQGVWFTEFAPGKVSILDSKKAVKEFDIGLVSGDGTRKVISYPYGLAVDGNRVWITANGMGESPGELWIIDDTSNLETAKPRKVVSFGGDPSPRDIAVDTAGYHWVSLFYGHKVVQITNAGVVVKEYDVDASALPGAIAYGFSQDEIWVSDETAANHRVIRLTPIDKIGPARDGKIAIAAMPETGVAAKGKPFAPWKVAVKENNQPVERHITLSIEPTSKASFADGRRSIIVATDKTTGEFWIETLKAAAGAANGDQFVITATTRGLKTPVTLYTAHIGEDSRIDKTPLPVTDVTVADKVYDGTVAATLHGGTIHPVPNDDVNLVKTGATGKFAQKDVGEHIAVTPSGYTLTGKDAGKYDLQPPTDLKATITPKELTATLTEEVHKVYDGNKTATVKPGDIQLSGVVSGEAVTAVGAATYDDEQVGSSKTVKVSEIVLTGADPNTDPKNYTLQEATVQADVGVIDKAPLAVEGVTVADKVYDEHDDTATLHGGSISQVPGDIVTLETAGVTGKFVKNEIGTDIPVTVNPPGYTISGRDAGNYALQQPKLKGTIKAPMTTLTVTLEGTASKIYDGTPTAPREHLTYKLNGVAANDKVDVDDTKATAVYDDKNVNVGTKKKTVTVTGLVLTGDDKKKYTLATTPVNGQVGTITPKLLTVEVNNARRRVGQPNPPFHYKITGFVPGEDEKLVTGIHVTTTADANSRPGQYPIKASGGSAPNYTFEYRDGALEIHR